MILSNILKKYAKQKETAIKLKYLYELKSVNLNNLKYYKNQSIFLHNELSVRLSHRIFDLMKLPYGLPTIKEINNIIELYYNSFERIQNHPLPINDDKILSFTKLLEDIKIKHNFVEETIATGLKKINNPLIEYDLINSTLNKFFLSRISIRTLISHQIENINNNKCIIKSCNINNILNNVINDLTYLSNRFYDFEPSFNIINNNNINLLYINSNLYYILSEILKNSITSHYNNNINDNINIILTETNNHVIIKISDKGLGFNINKLNKIMSYSYTTNANILDKSYNINETDILLSGLGVGLPLTKLYIEYFGGKLYVNPIENIGTDVYIYINKIDDSIEFI